MQRGLVGAFRILIVSIPVLFAGASATADSIPIEGLVNTGVDGLGNVLTSGSLEQNYAKAGPAGSAKVIAPHPLWAAAPAGAAWIGVANGDTTSPDGDYAYSIMFDMTGLDLASAMISAQVASDNRTQVLLNGNLVSFDNGSAGYMQLADLLIEDGFIGGMNTLEFVVTNEPYAGTNPSGLLVANIVGSAMAQVHTPEPSTAALLFLGLAGLTVAGRRR
jgi:hypothetical protein